MFERNFSPKIPDEYNIKIIKTVSNCFNTYILFQLIFFKQLNMFSFNFRLHASEAQKSLSKEMAKRKQQLHEIEQTLPKPNGTYLQIILGNVNVSILNKNDK